MKTGTFLCFGLIFFVAAETAAAPKVWRMTPIEPAEATAQFQKFCTRHLLNYDALVKEINGDSGDWTFLTKNPRSHIAKAKYWRSNRGEIGYNRQPGLSDFINDPGCHFTFVRATSVSHDQLVAATVADLGLSNGKDASSKSAKQMRWDYQKIGGNSVRIFVTSDLKVDGLIVSRLSVSRHRLPAPAAPEKGN